MNVKKMTTEHLREVISSYDADMDSPHIGPNLPQSEHDYAKECRKELMRRWGIKG